MVSLTRTVGPHGIVLGKGLLTIMICPALAERKPPSPHTHLTAPPGLSPQTCTQAALYKPQLPAAVPVSDTSTHPQAVEGGTSVRGQGCPDRAELLQN